MMSQPASANLRHAAAPKPLEAPSTRAQPSSGGSGTFGESAMADALLLLQSGLQKTRSIRRTEPVPDSAPRAEFDERAFPLDAWRQLHRTWRRGHENEAERRENLPRPRVSEGERESVARR